MSFLSKVEVASAIIDTEVKRVFRRLIGIEVVAAAGSTQADATALTGVKNIVTAADGTVGVILPKADIDRHVVVVNTVSNQTLKVYPEVGGVINAASANAAFSVLAGTEATFYCDAIGHWYVRATGTLTGVATSATTAELNVLAGVTAGTVAASSGVVVNAAKSVDVLQATTALTVGGTGVPGAAVTMTSVTKAITAFTDTTAKDVFTVTVPNAAHAARIEVDCLGVLGAGGAVGAGESTMSTKYIVNLARFAGAATVVGVSTAIGAANAKVAGADDITSVVVTASAMAGAIGAQQTFTIKVAITRSGAGASNHTGVFTARVLNQNATGVTIA